MSTSSGDPPERNETALEKVSGSVLKPSKINTDSFHTSWDPTPNTSQIMPISPTGFHQPDICSAPDNLNAIEVKFPVASDSDSDVDVIQQISATINHTEEANTTADISRSIASESSRKSSTKCKAVKQLKNQNNNLDQVKVPSNLPENVSSPAIHSGVFEEVEMSTSDTPSSQTLVTTSKEPLLSNTKGNNGALVPAQDLGIESEETLIQVQKLLDQAVNSYVPDSSNPVQDVNTMVSEPVGMSTSNTPVNVEPSQSTPSSFHNSIETVVEMLLETAKNLSGLINPGEMPKSSMMKTGVKDVGIMTTNKQLSNPEPVCETVVDEKQASIDHTQQDSTNEHLPSATDCLPGPSGLQQDTDNSTITTDEEEEPPGLHASKEIQSLLDVLLSTAESHCQNSSSKKDSKCTESPGAKIHKCPECDKYFARLSSLKRHILLHMDSRPFQCDQCEANYKSASQLNRHKRLHTGEKPAKCEFCNKDFRTYNELYVHRRTHTGEKPYECQYCGKCFSTRGYRNTHQRIHTGEKRFECDFCGMKFTESSARRVHRFTHTGETPYKCKVCGRGFTQAGNLNKHMKSIHSKGKPFKCQDCDKSFSIKQELRRHFQRVHSTDKPYKCSVCNKSYAIFSDLTYHMQSHVFRCTKCGEKFKDSKELERHIIEVCVLPGDLETSEQDEDTEAPSPKRGKRSAASGGGKGKSNAKRQRRSTTDLSSSTTKKRKSTVECQSQDSGAEQTEEQ